MSLNFFEQQEAIQVRRWGLFVGVNMYTDVSIRDLRYSVNDACAIHDLFAHSPLYDPERLCLLVNDGSRYARTTRETILNQLHRMAESAESNDLLLFYFSGHGYAIQGEAYLLSADTQNSRMLPDTAIPLRRVKEIMQDSAARIKIIILDACHLGIGLTSRAAEEQQEAFLQGLFEQAEGIAILASSARDELSWEDPDKHHGIFTYYLLRGLSGAANHYQSTNITFDELVHYLHQQMNQWARRNHIQQRPTLDFKGTGEWVLIAVPEQLPVQPVRQEQPALHDQEELQLVAKPLPEIADFWDSGLAIGPIEQNLHNVVRKVILVQGGPASGKTSLLRFFYSRLTTMPRYRQRYHPYWIDPYAFSSLPSFAREIWAGVKKHAHHTIADSEVGSRTVFEVVGNFVHQLHEACSRLSGLVFVVFIDELDAIYSQCSEFEVNRILGLIRHLVENHDIPIMFFVSMVRDLPQSYRSRLPAEKFLLRPLHPSPFDELAQRLFQSYGCLDEAALAWLYSYTGGQRFALKLILEQLVSLRASSEGLLTIDELRRAGHQARASSTTEDVIRHIYADDLNNDERSLMIWIASMPDGKILEENLSSAAPPLRRATKELLQRGYLAQHINNSISIRSGMIAEWLRDWSHFEEELLRIQPFIPASAHPATATTISSQGIAIYQSTQRVYVDGQEIKQSLTDLEYKALLVLAARSDQVVPKEEFALHVWGEQYYEQDDKRISALIHRLRTALGESQRNPRYLETLPKRGFRLQHAVLL